MDKQDSKVLEMPLMTESEQQRKMRPRAGFAWILYALASGVAMGGAIYLFTVVTIHGGLFARTMGSPGFLFFFLSYQAGYSVFTKKKTGSFFAKRRCVLYDQNEKFSWLRLYICVQDGLLFFGNFLLSTTSMHFAYYAEINQGVITCLFALETVYLAGMAYLFQREKLQLYQVVGMTMLVSCVIVLGLSDLVTNAVASVPEEDRVTVFLPILFGVIGPFFFAVRLYTAKYFSRKFNVDAMNISMTGQAMVEPFILITGLVLYANGFFANADWYMFARALGGACCSGLGILTLTQAVSLGKAGPASGITLIQTPLSVLLSAAIDGQATNYLELLSVALSIAGSLIIIMGEEGVLKCLQKKTKQETES